jgi:signal transduction histidine kinase
MTSKKQLWRYVRALAAPLLLWTIFVIFLIKPLQTWLQGDRDYDEAAMQEWLEETRGFHETLPEMVRDYLRTLDQGRGDEPGFAFEYNLSMKVERIREHLKALGNATKMYDGQLPLFPRIYSFRLQLEGMPGAPAINVVWDSNVTRPSGQYRELHYPIDNRAMLTVQYQLHAYNKRQRSEQIATARLRWVGVLAVAGTIVAGLWFALVQNRERERDRQRTLALQKIDQAEHLRLEEELRRRDAEQRQEEAERSLLEQRLATQAAEQQALELKSQLYASIGIMAGSYAHNIKNLLVRPNDLLRRCLEGDGLPHDKEHMLHEVRQTLGTVTERLQQILRTVRRDPSRTEMARLNLNELVCELHATWTELARDKWKLQLAMELSSEPLWIEGDVSHLQQAVENLLFNARDATFEMRNHLRDEARRQDDLEPPERRQALIAAAGWLGRIVMRTRRQGDAAIFEVQDNGIGMTEEVRRRCTETHFSTKRDNAIYEGNSTGMGLGLSFVTVILAHHHGQLEIVSEPNRGALLRVQFPLSATETAVTGVRSSEESTCGKASIS